MQLQLGEHGHSGLCHTPHRGRRGLREENGGERRVEGGWELRSCGEFLHRLDALVHGENLNRLEILVQTRHSGIAYSEGVDSRLQFDPSGTTFVNDNVGVQRYPLGRQPALECSRVAGLVVAVDR